MKKLKVLSILLLIGTAIFFLMRWWQKDITYLDRYFGTDFRHESYSLIDYEHYPGRDPSSYYLIKLTQPFRSEFLDPSTYDEGISEEAWNYINIITGPMYFPDDSRSIVIPDNQGLIWRLTIVYSAKEDCYWLFYLTT